MYKHFFYLLFFSFTTLAFPQKHRDTLSNYHHNKMIDSITVVIEQAPKKGLMLLDSLSNHIIIKDKPLFTVIKHYYKGGAYRNLRNFERAIFHYEETKKYAKEYNFLLYMPEVYREMGDEYMDQDMWQKAKKSYDNAIFWYKKFGDKIGVITCTYEGFIEHEQKKYDQSNRILKRLLPVLRKSNPVYLDGLSTIALNYLALGNVDSAYAYVNKMPLDSIDDINNFNYSLHKHYVYVLYYLDKKNVEKANVYNEIIGKNRFAIEIEGYYFENKIAIAKLTNNVKDFQRYTDSLKITYEKRLEELERKDVYTAEKVISSENLLTSAQKKTGRLQLYIAIILLVIILVAVFVNINFKKKKNVYEKMLVDLKNQIQHLADYKTESNLDSLESKVIIEAQKFDLTERETDVLLHLAKGLNNQQIADQLFISVNTIKYHIRNIYEKMDVKKRSEITSRILLDR